MFELRRWEWGLVALVIAIVVAVNKLVVHDRGNTWYGLFAVSFWVGIGVVHLVRRVRRSDQHQDA